MPSANVFTLGRRDLWRGRLVGLLDRVLSDAAETTDGNTMEEDGGTINTCFLLPLRSS